EEIFQRAFARAEAEWAEKFLAKIRAYAAKKQLPTSGPNWLVRAVFVAAAEHPDLDVTKRSRGRPAREVNRLLSVLLKQPTDAQKALVADIEAITRVAEKEGVAISEGTAKEYYVAWRLETLP